MRLCLTKDNYFEERDYEKLKQHIRDLRRAADADSSLAARINWPSLQIPNDSVRIERYISRQKKRSARSTSRVAHAGAGGPAPSPVVERDTKRVKEREVGFGSSEPTKREPIPRVKSPKPEDDDDDKVFEPVPTMPPLELSTSVLPPKQTKRTRDPSSSPASAKNDTERAQRLQVALDEEIANSKSELEAAEREADARLQKTIAEYEAKVTKLIQESDAKHRQDVNRLNSELVEARQKVQELSNANRSLGKQLDGMAEKTPKLVAELEAARAQKGQLQNVQAQLDELSKERDAARQDAEKRAASLRTAEGEMARLRTSATEANNRLTDALFEKRATEEARDALQAQLAKSESNAKKLEEAQSRLDSAEKAAGNLRDGNAELQEKKSALESQLSAQNASLQLANEQRKKEGEDCAEEKKRLNAKIKQLEDAMRKLERESAAKVARGATVESLTEQLNQQQQFAQLRIQEQQDAKAAEERANTERDEVRAKLEEMRAQSIALQQRLEQTSRQRDSIQKQLAEAQQGVQSTKSLQQVKETEMKDLEDQNTAIALSFKQVLVALQGTNAPGNLPRFQPSPKDGDWDENVRRVKQYINEVRKWARDMMQMSTGPVEEQKEREEKVRDEPSDMKRNFQEVLQSVEEQKRYLTLLMMILKR